MNKMRKFLLQAMAIKLAVVFLGISIMGVGYALGELWFKLNETDDDIRLAIEDAPTRAIDARNEFGQTGLMFAASYGKFDMAKQLIAKGADINGISNDQDKNTPLHTAIYNGSVPGSYDIATLLIDEGAKVNTKNNLGQQPIHFVIQISSNLVGVYDRRLALIQRLKDAGVDLNAKDKDGNTLLHLSASIHDILWLKALLQVFGNQLDLSIKNNQGQTPQDVARALNVNDPDGKMIELLQPPVTH